jgi:NADH dehydrogenase
MWACGDAAAGPRSDRDGTGHRDDRAARAAAGRTAGRNIAAALGHGKPRPYKHHNVGFVVDLGGFDAAADPLGVPLGGFPAKLGIGQPHLEDGLPPDRRRVLSALSI